MRYTTKQPIQPVKKHHPWFWVFLFVFNSFLLINWFDQYFDELLPDNHFDPNNYQKAEQSYIELKSSGLYTPKNARFELEQKGYTPEAIAYVESANELHWENAATNEAWKLVQTFEDISVEDVIYDLQVHGFTLEDIDYAIRLTPLMDQENAEQALNEMYMNIDPAYFEMHPEASS